MTRANYTTAIISAFNGIPALAGIPAIYDNATENTRTEIENALAAAGIVIVLLPILGTVLRDQQSHRRSERAHCTLRLRSSPALCPPEKLAAAIDAILDALQAQDTWSLRLGHANHPHRMDLISLTDLIPGDSGHVTYAINFTIALQ
jgi:hypothetical protein